MTIAKVQSRSVQGSGVTSVSLAFSSNVTAGNAYIVGFSGYSTGTTTVTDNHSSTLARDISINKTSSEYSSIHSLPNVTGGATTITATDTGTNQYPTLQIYEFSGLDTSSILDVTASSTGSSASHSTGTTATTTQADELAFAVDTHGGNTSTPTVNNGFTLGEVQSSSSNEPGGSAYKILTATGTQTVTFTWQNASWAAAIATYKAAAGGGSITYNQSLTATQANSPVIVKQVGKSNKPIQGNTVVLLKQSGKTIKATKGNAATLAKRGGKSIAATKGSAATALKQVNKPLTATEGNSAAVTAALAFTRVLTATLNNATTLIKQVLKPLSSSQSQSTTLLKQTGKSLIASPVLTATLAAIKVILVYLTATLSNSATLVRAVGKTVIATVLVTGASLIKRVGKLLTLIQILSATQTAIKVILVTLSATVGKTATLVKSTGKGLSSVISLAATLNRGMGKSIIAASTTTAPAILKSVGKRLTASRAVTASLIAIKVILVSLSANVGNAVTLVKRVGSVRVAGATLSALLTRVSALSLSLTATIVLAPVVRKGIGLTLGVVKSLAAFVATVFRPFIPSTKVRPEATIAEVAGPISTLAEITALPQSTIVMVDTPQSSLAEVTGPVTVLNELTATPQTTIMEVIA